MTDPTVRTWDTFGSPRGIDERRVGADVHEWVEDDDGAVDVTVALHFPPGREREALRLLCRAVLETILGVKRGKA